MVCIDPGALPVKDSGTRTQFSTGAVRDGATGKGRFDLLPCHALRRLAQVFEKGAAKYEPRNWEKGIDTHRYVDSAIRHLVNYLEGRRDENYRDEDHLGQALWNVACLIETEHWIQRGRLPAELDTLP